MNVKSRLIEFKQTKEDPPINSYEAIVKTANGKKVLEIDVFQVPRALSLQDDKYLVNVLTSYQRDGGNLRRLTFGVNIFILRDKGASEVAKKVSEEFAKPTFMDKLLRR
jgi:hypothetical protein